MKRYFYFRTVTSAAADDNIDDSILVPVENITGFYGQSDTRIDVYFSPVTLSSGEGAPISNDSVQLTVASSKTNEVIQALCEATNNGPHEDGITVIADDLTETYLTSDITACSTITNAAILPDEG